MPTFDVNMDGAIEFTAKLEKLHRSAFPSAVRNTLNDAAIATKILAPKVAGQKFTIRQKTFFKAFTTAQKATGFNIKSMNSVVGITRKKGTRIADGLEAQETGGSIDGRKLIPHNKGRVSGSHNKKLKRKHRLSDIKIAKKGNKGSKSSGYLLIKKGDKGTVFEVKKLRGTRKLLPVFHYRNTKKTTVKKTPFIRPAAKLIARKLPEFYKNNAEFQFNKLLK